MRMPGHTYELVSVNLNNKSSGQTQTLYQLGRTSNIPAGLRCPTAADNESIAAQNSRLADDITRPVPKRPLDVTLEQMTQEQQDVADKVQSAVAHASLKISDGPGT